MTELGSFGARRVVAVDLDGTALDGRKRLTERTRRALALVNRSGFLVVPVSGRIFGYLKQFHAECELDGPVIGYNGAACLLPSDDRVLFEEHIDVPLSHELLAFARERDVHVNFYSYDLVYFDRPGQMADYYVRTYGVPFEVVEDLSALGRPTVKVLMLAPETQASRIVGTLQNEFRGKIEVSLSEATHVEILKAGVDKGRALARLCGQLDIAREDVIAVGDGQNDASMIRWAGEGVAMSNAHENTREAADRVIGHCDGEALAEFLENLPGLTPPETIP